jgi:16S rRNA (guanine527-N7)-methyltransferase
MQPARIAELLRPFVSPDADPRHSEQGRRSSEEPAVLSTTQLQYISTYIDILLRWNARINLTAVHNEEEIVTRHFGESLFAARHLFPAISPLSTAAPGFAADRSSAVRVADLGSGAGFPGIPIKLWARDISMTLIESNQKKASFLREVVRTLTLTDVDVQNRRAENVQQTFDQVTLRAVECFAYILPVAARLLAPNARLALLIGSGQADEARAILPDLCWRDPFLVPESKSRILFVGSYGTK